MSDIIKKVQAEVKRECQKDSNIYEMNAYGHFVHVAEYGKILAKKRKADSEIIELAAWMHDIGSVLGDMTNHHIVGAKYAGELLAKYNYSQDKIEAVQHCILAHRGSQKIKRETLEAICLADADAMTHFDRVADLFRLALVSMKMDYKEAEKFVYEKLGRSYKKLTPTAKKIVKKKYEAVKVLFG